jgi:hypothetical protein
LKKTRARSSILLKSASLLLLTTEIRIIDLAGLFKKSF